MFRIKKFIWLLLFGSLWGISEVFVGGVLYGAMVPRASVYLSVWAVFMLAVARGMFNKPGTSTAISIIAALYKLVNTSPFFCHICGILFLGIAFDLAASLLMKDQSRVSYRSVLAGVAGAYGGHALFAIFVTYIIRYEYWAGEGLPKVLDHIFVNGSLTAVFSILAFPLGQWIGLNGESFSRRRPGWAYSVALLFSIIIWALGRIAA